MSNFSCSLSRNITSHSMENLTLHFLLRWKMIIITNSHYLTYTFLIKKVGRMYVWNLGVKGLKTFQWYLWLRPRPHVPVCLKTQTFVCGLAFRPQVSDDCTYRNRKPLKTDTCEHWKKQLCSDVWTQKFGNGKKVCVFKFIRIRGRGLDIRATLNKNKNSEHKACSSCYSTGRVPKLVHYTNSPSCSFWCSSASQQLPASLKRKTSRPRGPSRVLFVSPKRLSQTLRARSGPFVVSSESLSRRLRWDSCGSVRLSPRRAGNRTLAMPDNGVTFASNRRKAKSQSNVFGQNSRITTNN